MAAHPSIAATRTADRIRRPRALNRDGKLSVVTIMTLPRSGTLPVEDEILFGFGFVAVLRCQNFLAAGAGNTVPARMVTTPTANDLFPDFEAIMTPSFRGKRQTEQYARLARRASSSIETGVNEKCTQIAFPGGPVA